jgi:radical SAM protein with 4Fe4S-binding SPASM domain
VKDLERLRYSREDFGYLIVFPDGRIDLYRHDVEPLLNIARTSEQLAAYRLDTFIAGGSFHLRSPLIVWLEVTRKCNLLCTHCYIDAGRPRKDEMSTAEFKALLDDLKRAGTFSVVFAGGEPYLRADFEDILAYAAQLDFIIAVVSNGTYLNAGNLARFPRENCRLTLSVDGIDAHNTIRGGASTFELMRSKVDLARAKGVPVSISTVISKANIHELERLLEWCISEDVVFRTVTFNPLGRGLANLDQHALSEDDAARSAQLFMMQKRFEAEKDKTIGPCVSKFFNYALTLMYMTRREHCSRSIGYVAANGDVYPCVTSAATELFGAGNVRDTPFSVLWEESFREMRAITWSNFEVCGTCPYSAKEYFCANRCPCMSLVLNGELFGCGATAFEREDLRLRTARLRSEMNYVN